MTERGDPLSLELAADHTWYRIRGETYSLARYRLLQRLVATLAQHRQTHPGEPLATDALIEGGWPGERILASAARNRLWVALNRLRKLGLRDVLASRDGGYLLTVDVVFPRDTEQLAAK